MVDPVSIIVGALIAGAAAATKDVTGQAIKDAYGGLKKLLVGRFGGQSNLENAVSQLEAKPDSKNRQGVVQEEIESSTAVNDPEVVRQAQALLDLLRQAGGLTAAQYNAIVTGSGAAAVGPGAVAAGKGGVAVGGSVEGGVHLGGKREAEEDETDG
ncbi:MAG: hypothetical protein U0X20_03450 [Caldilineaceae bacterium]